jgi:hypothetical protein
MSQEYDYIIIGAGIAGLYCGLLLSIKYPQRKVLILERNDYIGGRVLSEKFCGKEVVIGAGIGRLGKDENLYNLLKRYNMPIKPYHSEKSYVGFEHIDVHKVIKDMQKKQINKTKTFKENFIHIYGQELWKKFVLSAGYDDFGASDVIDVLYGYGWDDYDKNSKYYPVDWELLKDNMVNELKQNGVTIQKNMDVKSVIKLEEDDIRVEAENTKRKTKKVFETRTIIFATNLYGLKNLYKNQKYSKYITSQIECQPFMRCYFKSGDPIDVIPHYTVFNNFLQKVIPMGDNIYMIYSDNKRATDLNKMNIDDIRSKLEKMFDINVCKIAKYYWPCGTHYYKPLKYFKDREEFINAAQHPEKNVFVIGEVISDDQGWTNGALESVRRLF